jgi:hypothetical protein
MYKAREDNNKGGYMIRFLLEMLGYKKKKATKDKDLYLDVVEKLKAENFHL